MVKLELRSPVVVLGISVLIIWFAVITQKHCGSREDMTGSPKFSDDDKKAVMDFLTQSIADPEKASKVQMTANATAMISFLNANPITTIDDKFITNVSTIANQMASGNPIASAALAKPGVIKDGLRLVTQMVVAQAIWLYADSYEKLKEAPSQSDFRAQLTAVIETDPRFTSILDTVRNTKESEHRTQQALEYNNNRLKTEKDPATIKAITDQNKQLQQGLSLYGLQDSILGNDTYPLGSSSSPTVNQVFDIVYKYYFGETFSASGAASALWTTLIATFGSLGAVAVVGGLVYFFFFR